MAFKVKVVGDSGKGIKGAKVTLSFSGWTGGVTSGDYTDGSGYASIDCDRDRATVTIYVDGADVGKHAFDRDGSVTVQHPRY